MCHVWYELAVLIDTDDWDFVRPFTIDCCLPAGHEGPHMLEVCYQDEEESDDE